MITKNDDMVAGVVDADIMMMSTETGKYYQLNQTGGEIWGILDMPQTIASICDILESRFNVERDVIERELMNYIRELSARRIVMVK